MSRRLTQDDREALSARSASPHTFDSEMTYRRVIAAERARLFPDEEPAK